jgi:hypothetical protein
MINAATRKIYNINNIRRVTCRIDKGNYVIYLVSRNYERGNITRVEIYNLV